MEKYLSDEEKYHFEYCRIIPRFHSNFRGPVRGGAVYSGGVKGVWPWVVGGLVFFAECAKAVAGYIPDVPVNSIPLVTGNFTDIRSNPSGTYHLAEDIDLGAVNTTAYNLFNESVPFSGRLSSGPLKLEWNRGIILQYSK